MPVCPYMASCAMFPLLKTARSLKVWQDAYCESDYQACARHQRSTRGKMSPMNLLPNGQMLVVGGGGTK